MPFVKNELEVLTAKAVEYKLIADLATDPVKRQQYEWLANEMRDLVKRADAERPKATPAAGRDEQRQIAISLMSLSGRTL